MDTPDALKKLLTSLDIEMIRDGIYRADFETNLESTLTASALLAFLVEIFFGVIAIFQRISWMDYWETYANPIILVSSILVSSVTARIFLDEHYLIDIYNREISLYRKIFFWKSKKRKFSFQDLAMITIFAKYQRIRGSGRMEYFIALILKTGNVIRFGNIFLDSKAPNNENKAKELAKLLDISYAPFQKDFATHVRKNQTKPVIELEFIPLQVIHRRLMRRTWFLIFAVMIISLIGAIWIAWFIRS